MTAVQEEVVRQADTDDHDHLSHYVKKDQYTDSVVFGEPITALCGKKWIPSRDPRKYPICSDCKRIYEGISE